VRRPVRIVISELMSLDGVVQAPGGGDPDGGFAHGGWSMPYFDPATMGPPLDELLRATEALLFGRRTWQAMAAAWPDRAGDPFADRMNRIEKYVASRTLTQDDLGWANSTCCLPMMWSARCADCKQPTAATSRSWEAQAWPARSSPTTWSTSTA